MRVIIADHHAPARQGLAILLREQADITLIGEAAEASSLLALAAERPVDAVLLDFELPGLALAEAIAQIHALDPAPRVIVISSNPEHARIALASGADTFVSKSERPEWLLSALQRCRGNWKFVG